MALPKDEWSEALHRLFTQAQKDYLNHLKWLASRERKKK